MAKGHNADGSKKVRPANSGRKAVPHKSISPDITLEAAAVLAGLKKKGVNLNKFISAAILEKAARDAEKKAAIKEATAAATPGQVHLVDMIQEIKLERVVEYTKKHSMPEVELSENVYERVRELQDMREQQERDDLNEWIQMPADITANDISNLIVHYTKKPQKTALFIQLRVYAPVIDVRGSWRCWLELVDEAGAIINNCKQKASAAYCESIFSNPAWKESHLTGTSFYLLPVGNEITAPKPKAIKPKVAKVAKVKRAKGDGSLMSILADPMEELPEWLQVPAVAAYTPEAEEEVVNMPAWML